MEEWRTDDYGSKATKKKIYVGKGIKYFDKSKAGEFMLESHKLSIGNEVIITGPTTGIINAKVQELRISNISVDSVKRGDVFSMPLIRKIRPSDKLYKVLDNSHDKNSSV